MRFEARRAPGPLLGSLHVPGDKSMSHRAVLFAAIAQGTSELSGILDSADVRTTIVAVSMLGARCDLESASDGSLAGTVTGWGSDGPSTPDGPIDCGNSGTTARLLAGVVASWPITVTLTGDASLSRRPMGRITEPLSAMGARFETTDGCLPMTIKGSDLLVSTTYATPVASAQVKSAVLLAGLRASGRTTVTEPASSRDHTERMLPLFGVQVGRDESTCGAWVDGPVIPDAATVRVPADPSSAAFPAVAAAIVEGSEVVLENVGLNPSRAGFLVVLERMGADLDIDVDDLAASEPMGSITVRYRPGLVGTTVTVREIPQLIDEVPILAVAAAQANGVTRFEGVGELRVKESDRLQAVVEALTALGVTVTATEDTLEIVGRAGHPFQTAPTLRLPAMDDHRLAMSWAVAGLVSATPFSIIGFETVDVSYPRFAVDMESIGAM